MIQRYHMIGQVTQIADETGNWVKYSDHADEIAVFRDAPSIDQVKELQEYYQGIESYMIATGRHKPLSDEFLARVRPVWEWLRRVSKEVA